MSRFIPNPHSLGLSCAATNLRQEQVNTEWCILIGQVALEFSDLFSEHVWGVANLRMSACAPIVAYSVCLHLR